MATPGCDCVYCKAERGGPYSESAAEQLRRQLTESMRISPSSLGSISIGYTPSIFSIYDPAKETKKPMTTSDHSPESLAAAVRSLADKDNNADLSVVNRAVERVNAERKDRIAKALKGVADLAVLGGTKSKRFVLVYWDGDEARTAQGIEYPIEKRNAEGESTEYTVLINDSGHPFYSKYYSMTKLRKFLDDTKLTYTIAYFDN